MVERSATEDKDTINVNGHHLIRLNEVPSPLPGKLCWQTFDKGSTASIECRKVSERRKPDTYHVFRISLGREFGPSGYAVYACPVDAFRASKELGGQFAQEYGPRGD